MADSSNEKVSIAESRQKKSVCPFRGNDSSDLGGTSAKLSRNLPKFQHYPFFSARNIQLSPHGKSALRRWAKGKMQNA